MATPATAPAASIAHWFDRTVLELGRQLRWSYLPPLMVYLAAGMAGLTAVVGTFFIKDYLGLSAAFIAGLAFWVGIPWALKMPIGHLVDLIWRWKFLLVWLGAAILAASLLIMYALISHTEAMTAVMSREAWFVLSSLLSPVGYVIQDVVADAMTVEAVPPVDEEGRRHSEAEMKAMHTTMQTLGRIAVISGLIFVAVLNITMFAGVSELSQDQQAEVYARIYLAALAVPVVSVLGVSLGGLQLRLRANRLRRQGVAAAEVERLLFAAGEATEPNWWIFGGGLAFAVWTLTMGLAEVPFAQELIFAGSLAIVAFLMRNLIRELKPELRLPLVGTAIIIFIFRATPLPGPGVSWWEIDVLGFDQQFLSVLTLITSVLTMAGMLLLRPLIADLSIAAVVALLTVASGIMMLPNIGLYYGLHHWTAAHTGGVVDARFIAILDTAIESPLGQISMIPMLAWIANSAPPNLKATFFAVMASFTNLALSAASLGTRYLNQVFVVTRRVTDPQTGAVVTPADYSQVGWLLLSVMAIGVLGPLLTIALIQASPLRTRQ